MGKVIHLNKILNSKFYWKLKISSRNHLAFSITAWHKDGIEHNKAVLVAYTELMGTQRLIKAE